MTARRATTAVTRRYTAARPVRPGRPGRSDRVDPLRELVPLRRLAVPMPLCWFALGPADRPMVEAGQRIGRGDTLLERARDAHLAEVSVRAPVGTRMEPVRSPVEGAVEVIEPGAIGIRATGVGIAGVVMHGEPVHGRLLVLADAADAELRATAVDVQGAGAIVVAGAGLDIETVTRARATGIAGIVTGGIAGKDLATLAAADQRQRASLHPTTGFAVLVVDGYGRRPLPGLAWAWLRAAAGTDAGIVADPPMLVLDSEVDPPLVTYDVRIAAGDALGMEGRLLGAAGQRRSRSGLYGAVARVGIRSAGSHELTEHLVPFADLERFE